MNMLLNGARGTSTKALVAAGAALCLNGVGYSDAISTVLDGLKEGSKASLDMRARYEYNEIGANEINGYSLRTRLGYTTGEYEGWKAMIELEDLSFNNDDDRPGLDVPTTELNQVWLSYGGAKLGRQIYTLDDQRFIGHVGWRQNIQTFDALSGSFAAGDTVVNLAYLDAVHRINATSQDLVGLLGNVKYKVNDNFDLTGFAYSLDFDLPALASSDTFGLRGTGTLQSDDLTFGYSFSYALQQDNGGSTADFDVSYLAADVSTTFSGLTVKAGVEILEGDGTVGFTTPLATVHKFNGFADVFAGGSLGLGGGLPQGLEDYFVMFGFKAGPVPVKLFYHEFDAEGVSASLGSEIDAVATYKVNEYMTLLAKYAKYDSDQSGVVAYGGADKTVFTMEANLKF